MASIKNMLIRLGVIADDVDSPVNRTTRGLQRVARQADHTERSLRRLGLGFDSVGSAAGSLSSRLASFTGTIAATVGRIAAGAAALAVLSSAMASAGGAAVGLVAALAPVSGLLAALPGIALAGGAAMTVWKLATAGLTDAMGAALSGNVEALAKAMSSMSDSGREFITEFNELVPLLKSFQEAAQGAFLNQINGELTGWINALSGLKPAIRDAAAEMGGMVRTFFEVGTSREGIEQLDRVLRDTHTLIGSIHLALEPLLKGFLDLGLVGSAWLAGMSGGLTDVLTKFGQWMTRIAESGQAMAWLDAAVEVLKQLGTLVGDVFGILTGLLRAASAAGGDVLGVIGQLVGKFHEWVDSAQGQETLITIFRALNDIGSALMPVITALAGALAGIAPTVGRLAELIGPILTTAINALAPAIEALGPGVIAVFTELGTAVQTLADSGALIDIADAISAILIAVAPLLPALADILVPVLQGLAWLITNALAPALSTLAEWIRGVIAVIQGGEGLGEDHPLSRFAVFVRDSLIPAVQEVWDKLVQAFTDISVWVNENRATFEAWGAKIGEIFGIVTGIWGQIFELIGQVFTDIQAWLSENQTTWTGWGDKIGSIIQKVGEIVSGVWEAISIAWDTFGGPLLDMIGGIFGGILQVIDGVMTAIGGLIDVVLGVITGDWERAWGGVKDFFGGIWDAILGILNAVWSQIKGLISAGLAIVGDTWDGAWNKVKTVVERVWDAISGWISDKVNDVKNFIGRLSEIPGQVAGWFGQVRQAIIDRFNDAVDFVRGIPGRITGALGDLGNLLYNAGRDLIMGFWNGVVSLWNWLVGEVQNLFGGLAGWAKSILGIASPSKVFASIGREIPAGMALGIERAAGMVESAVSGLSTSATVGVSMAGGGMAPAAAFVPPARSSGLTIENLHLGVNVDGTLDLRSDDAGARRLGMQIRDVLRRIEDDYK